MSARLVAAIASFVLLAVTFVPLERAFPARPGQRVLRSAFAIDLCFFLGQYLAFTGIAVSLLTWARAEAAGIAAAIATLSAPLPLPVRGIVVVVLGDVSVYWFHRACHRFEWLWRFHAVHHSARELDWLAAHREHPVDGITTQLLQNLPAISLGYPVEAIGALAAFRGMWAIFVHSNTRLPLGPLRWILGAPELHHWHHADVERTEHNFANLAPWLDVVFGTHHAPDGPETYPLGIREPWPEGYLAQLAHPFVLAVRPRERAPDADERREAPPQKSLIFQAPRSRTSAMELPEP